MTLVSYSRCMGLSLEAADVLAGEGISVECIDLRSISPIDKETLLASVAKTTRLVVAHEAVKQGGVGAELSAIVAEEGIDLLDAPIVRVGAPFTPVPFARPLEQAYRVTSEKIAEAVRGLF